MGGSKTYPYGSTNAVRAQVLAALGVLKLATAGQMHRLMAPGHKDNKAFRNAALDLARHGLTVSEGSSRDGHKIWSLTPLGLDAAAEVLGRPVGEMRGTARGAARSGAPHAMAVNETVIAMTRTPAATTRPIPRRQQTEEPSTAPAAVAPTPDAEPDPVASGLGWIGSWTTEVPLSASSSKTNRAGVRVDAVLQAPEAELPVLFVEVDNCTESADVLAAKFEKYVRYFRARMKSSLGTEMPAWRAHYRPSGRDGHPPVLIVFNPGTRIGPQALKNRMNTVMHLTRTVWSGAWHAYPDYGAQDGYYDYDDAIPILFTTLDRLRDGGPRGVVWWRCGHGRWETLTGALANPNDRAAWSARTEERRALRRQADQEREWGQEQAAASARRNARQAPELWPGEPAPSPASVVPACERCGEPLTGRGEDAPAGSEDGRHCPSCRSDVYQYPTLRQALFGRRPRGT
ncbi:replication-relaxation family protein [Streptomyces aureus]|uniref:replication-relaxation family protein n=1 Tax=Streptomyces aureus TaxID=193461 RepID=UPI000689AA91|nr:replication-relaxation family protein [Streptomyces aureus]